MVESFGASWSWLSGPNGISIRGEIYRYHSFEQHQTQRFKILVNWQLSIMQAPLWIPYGLRSRWDNLRVSRAISGIAHTRPYPVATSEDAEIEIHILVCRRDYNLSLVAAKSLLRFNELRASLTLTDDGSLDPWHREYISSHLPGCRWLPRVVDDERITRVMQSYQRIASVYQGPFSMIRKLLHPIILGSAPRILLLDSDTVFFRRPDRLIKWTRDRETAALYLHDDRGGSQCVSSKIVNAFDELKIFIGHQYNWTLQHYFFNAGLLAFDPSSLELKLFEKFLKWRSQLPEDFRNGEGSIWFGEWTIEQTGYMVMFGYSTSDAMPFGDGYKIGYDADQIFCHFLRHHLVRQKTLLALNQLVGTL